MKSLKTQLFFIMIILAIVPMLIISIYILTTSNNALDHITGKMMDNHAKDILYRVEDRLLFLEHNLIEFSTSPATTQSVKESIFDYETQKKFNSYLYPFLLSKAEVTRLIIVRRDGLVYGYNADSLSPYLQSTPIYKEDVFTAAACDFIDDFIKSGRDSAYVDFSFYRSNKVGEDTSLILCHRIRDPDTYEPIAAMITHVNFLELHSIFDNVTLWSQEEISLIKGDGHVLASTLKTAVGTTRERISTGDSTTHTAGENNGIKMEYSAMNGRYDIEVQVMVPHAVLKETERSQMISLIMILTFSVALLTVSFFFIKRRFFGKLGNLSKTLKGQERYPLDPIEGEWGNDEIGEIVDNYNIVTEHARQKFYLERERIERLKELELSALQSQIKPHFLYNTLDVGVWYAKEGNAEKIQELLINLSRYYRLSLSSGASYVTIHNELHHAVLYMEMERQRMSRAFQVVVNIPEALEGYFINKIVLQPLVENSIKHGIKPSMRTDSYIKISGKLVDNGIVLTVKDNGIGMSPAVVAQILEQDGSNRENGFAVANVHRRIALKYGKEYGLAYESEKGVGTTVRIKIPQILDASGNI